MTQLGPKERAAVLALATEQARAGATRARGAASAARLGQSLEEVVEAVWSLHGHAMRGQAISKVVGRGRSQRTVFVKKNGVDFVGVLHGKAVALEVKRLPGVASLRGSKDDSTAAEAAWLLAFRANGGAAGFLVHDPDAGRVYVVSGRDALAELAVGGPVAVREPDRIGGNPLWPCVFDTDPAGAVATLLSVLAHE